MRAIEKRLRERIKELEANIKNLEMEQQQWRNWWAQDFRDQINLISKNQYWTPQMWVERLAKRLNNVERWWW